MLFHNQKGSNSQVFNSKKKSTPDWTNPWIVLKQNQMKNQYLLWKKNSFSPLGSSGNGDLDKKNYTADTTAYRYYTKNKKM